VVYGYDEPLAPRTSTFLTAMYKHGASRAVLGSPNFAYRCSYILVGISNCAEGNGFEAYNGTGGSGGTNDWCEVSFYLQNSNLVISGSAATPRTLQDYAYTGAMDATYGATWGTNIDGPGLPQDYANAGSMSDCVNSDPFLRHPSEWTFSGATPTYVADFWTTEGLSSAFDMPSGAASDIYSLPFPISPSKTYLMESSVWKTSGATSAHYLFIVFYDAGGSIVHGSGWPASGLYEYYGLLNAAPASTGVNNYSITFGAGAGLPTIPSDAVTAQVGIRAGFSGSGQWSWGGVRVRPVLGTGQLEPNAATSIVTDSEPSDTWSITVYDYEERSVLSATYSNTSSETISVEVTATGRHQYTFDSSGGSGYSEGFGFVWTTRSWTSNLISGAQPASQPIAPGNSYSWTFAYSTVIDIPAGESITTHYDVGTSNNSGAGTATLYSYDMALRLTGVKR
jgi:hypothetical protein